jgi:hypothetical protein
VVRAAAELPVAARPAWRCKSEGFSDVEPLLVLQDIDQIIVLRT